MKITLKQKVNFHLSRFKVSIQYFWFNFRKDKNFEAGDRVRCLGIGYPHWKALEFEIQVVFDKHTIGLTNKVQVSAKDFIKINH